MHSQIKYYAFLPALASLPTVRKFVKNRQNETDKVNFIKVFVCLFVTEEILYSITAVSDQGIRPSPYATGVPYS